MRATYSVGPWTNSCPPERARFFDPDPTRSCDPSTDPERSLCKRERHRLGLNVKRVSVAWCAYAAPGPKKCARCEVYYTPCKCRGGVCCDSGYILGERPCWCCDGGVQSPYGALQPPI